MQIRTIRKGLEAFEFKFEPFEKDSKHSNANSNHSKGIRSIQMQIRTIQKGFKAFECKFEPFEKNSKDSKIIRSILIKFETFESDSKHLNANSNDLKGKRSIRK